MNGLQQHAGEGHLQGDVLQCRRLGDSSRQWPQELGSHDAGPRKDMPHRVNLSECENCENAVLTQTLNKPTLVNSSFS